MGQASIPVVNRTGYSMYWLSSWDDLHSYSRYFNEDVFVRGFFDDMFHRKISTNLIFFKQKERVQRYSDFLKRYQIYLRHSTNFKQVPRFLKRFYKIPYYWSKIRIIRFQKWLIIYFSIFSTNRLIVNVNVRRSKTFGNIIRFNKILLKHSLSSDFKFDF